MEVVGINGGPVTPFQGMVRQQDRKGSSAFEALDFRDYLLQGYRVAVVLIDGVEAGRTAGDVIWLHGNVQMKFSYHSVSLKLFVHRMRHVLLL
jgi:hypothetical protein